ncbi:MAG: 3-oxoadipyl-CoA thiolase [Spongiibacteraceae bacterium]|nr:3-oxoadipyl-CoA thiolase [Spongiibacteraceae bacterium]
MRDVFICDAIRTPIGRYGGALSSVRADDLAAIPIKALLERNPQLDSSAIDDVIMGCANQAGEDNRNVARMSALLAGLPATVTANTINRLCGSGMDAVGSAARAIKSAEVELMIAGGVESMSRAPLVMPKAEHAFSRNAQLFDTTIGWRFINPLMKAQYGVDSMPETAENVAEQFKISRADQDAFAFQSQQRAGAAQAAGIFAKEIVPVIIERRRQDAVSVDADEHLRPQTTLQDLQKLKTPFREGGSVTAGNASGVNDGACALLLASERALKTHSLTAKARVIAMACAGVEPRIMGYAPKAAIEKVLLKTGLSLGAMDVIELNEAFAAQALACTRALGLADNSERVNPNGGAIALGHPLGMSGARLITSATYQLQRSGGCYALCAMCIGVGQGIAMIIERV